MAFYYQYNIYVRGRGANEEHRPLPETAKAATTASSWPTTLKLPAYRGEGPPDAYLTEVWLATQIQGWSPEESTKRVVLPLEGEALKILDAAA